MPPPNSKLAERAFEAAKKSLDENRNVAEVCEIFGLKRHLVSLARIIMQYGTQEEIQNALNGKLGIRPTADLVKSRMPPETLAHLHTRSGVWTHNRRQRVQSDAEIWNIFRAGLKSLSELPSVADVVSVCSRNNMRKHAINQDLETASNWLKEFENEWAKQRLKSTKDTVDTGNGNTVSGMQHAQQTIKRSAC